ncbi:CotH kinase family protein [Alkalicoccus daliensis]|uniref:Leucine Rich repeat-containing protein n=1 Tax=Alkalicoccus daliensis TaxID=745820 RepID=A0A1H0GJI7_9BACI|nr:CotH kinase family protein [Alkalicoccus daliensis]SDO07038.1 Leucine Rich repeat-containing protein [Alkalicoccus daliensis]
MKPPKTILILVLIFPLLFLGWGAAYLAAPGPFITDEALEEAVRIEIDYPRGEIRPDQVEDIQELRFREAGIENLEGIDEFTSLVSLDVRDNQIEDISVLEELPSLTSLNLRGNQIEDISSLASLTNLRELNLRENSITDISPLSFMQQLEDVNIRHNQIESIEPLRNLNNLRERLYVEGNPIEDFSPVEHYLEEINDTDIEERFISSGPEFSYEAGFYGEPLEVELTADDSEEIYYTLDGSTPNPFSGKSSTQEYTGPIEVTARENEANQFASIRTNLLEDATNRRSWQEPPQDIPKASVIKAVSLNTEDNTLSSVETNTYFVNKESSLPVFSLSTDAEHFFSEETGIYAPGVYHDPDADAPDAMGNFEQRGREWEQPLHIEYFEEEQRVLAQDAGVRIHGGFTRRFPQKTLRLYARNDYGENLFRYPFFPEEPREEFKRLLLRQSGNDWGGTMFNDALMQRLVTHTEVETQAYQPSVVYLNGEYWGIHNLRERYDQHYFERKYDIDRENLVILEAGNAIEGNIGVDTGKPGDIRHYLEMLEFIEENDMSSEENYAHVQTLMDIDNFITYQAAQIYFKNTDWPHNNINFYRVKTDFNPEEPAPYDGRWRWLLYDTDHGFAYHGADAYEDDTMSHAAAEDEWSTSLLRNLLENEEFTQQFLTEFANQLNSSFDEDRVVQEIEEIQGTIAPEINGHIERWGLPESREAWEQLVEDTRGFARNRPAAMREHLVNFFDLSGTSDIEISFDSSRGSVFINTLEISPETPGITATENWNGTYFEGIPVTITAVPADGYTFAGWSGTSTEEAETIEILLEEDLALEAQFE